MTNDERLPGTAKHQDLSVGSFQLPRNNPFKTISSCSPSTTTNMRRSCSRSPLVRPRSSSSGTPDRPTTPVAPLRKSRRTWRRRAPGPRNAGEWEATTTARPEPAMRRRKPAATCASAVLCRPASGSSDKTIEGRGDPEALSRARRIAAMAQRRRPPDSLPTGTGMGAAELCSSQIQPGGLPKNHSDPHQDGRFADLAGAENSCGRRTADAFVEMANRAVGAGPGQPAVHPDVVVVVPQEALSRAEPDPFDPPSIIGGGPVTLAEVFRLALLGTVSTLTVDDCGRPLNLGRKHRLANSDQWIAASVRDRGCVAPGCDRPAAWCQLHHLRWWSHGGSTDLSNLACACSFHHHLIHDQGWNLEALSDGTWRLLRPDGTTVEPPRYAAQR